MTDPVLTIETTRLSVEPGGQVQTTLTVQNPGDIVEGYKLTVLGPGTESWGRVMPEEVQVYPGQETTAVLIFSPPTDASAGSGSFPFGIKAASVVDDDTSVVAEGDLDLGRVFGLQAKLSPVASTGRWSGQHLVQFTNWGNAPVRLKLTAADPDEKLAFLMHPDVIDVPIGATTPTALRVKTKKPFLRGQPLRLPFSVSAEPDPPEPAAVGPAGPLPVMADPRRAQVDGAFNQRPILSKWVILLALLLVAIIALLIILAVRRTPPPPPSAALGAGVPAIPTGLSATGTGETTITVGWDEQPGMESFRLYTLTADGKKSAVNELDGNLSQAPVENLQPGNRYCFRLQAVSAGKPSDLSEEACGDTVAAPVTVSGQVPTVTQTAPGELAPVIGAPTAPSGPAVSTPAASDPLATGPATPTPPPGSTPGSVPPTIDTTAGGTVTSVVGPTTNGGNPNGTPTPPATVTVTFGHTPQVGPPGQVTVTLPPGQTLPPTPSPATPSAPQTTVVTGPAVPVFTTTQWVGFLQSITENQTGAAGIAVEAANKWRVMVPNAMIMRSADFPRLRIGTLPVREPSYLIYVGPFNSPEEAAIACDGVCIPVQPNPPG